MGREADGRFRQAFTATDDYGVVAGRVTITLDLTAVDRRREDDARRAGEAVVNMLRIGLRPRDILTKGAFENAIALANALGGSTNAVLHLLAIANEAVWRLMSTDAWVNFKTFGLPAAMFAFLMLQSRLFQKYGTGTDE